MIHQASNIKQQTPNIKLSLTKCSIMITKEQKQTILQYLNPYNPNKVGIFGSYARGTEKENSDIDILINLQKQINLLELIELQLNLSDLLGIKVDLITERSLNKHLRPIIEKDIIYLIND